MKVLIACEESQEVCKAFRALQKQWRSNGGDSMRIVKLPADYVRYLNEGKHVVFNNYEYWFFLKGFYHDAWRIGCKRRHIKGGNIEEVKIV